MIPYNEGLFDGIVSAIISEVLHADQVWDLLVDNHFNNHDDNLLNIHLTEWLDYEKKVQMLLACPSEKSLGLFLETYSNDYLDDLKDLKDIVNYAA